MSEVPTSLPATAATGVRDVGESPITGASLLLLVVVKHPMGIQSAQL